MDHIVSEMRMSDNQAIQRLFLAALQRKIVAYCMGAWFDRWCDVDAFEGFDILVSV